MTFEIGTIISFTQWLSGKIADKGFDLIWKKIKSGNNIDEKFKEAIYEVSEILELKYPEVLGNSISYFFKQEDVFDELCKLLFVNQSIDLELINSVFDNSSLPDEFVLEFINELKKHLARKPDFREIIADKELYIAVKGISKNVEELATSSTLSKKEISKIKELLEKQFLEKFNLDNFKSLYLKNLVNNISQISFIGLGLDPSIRKGKRKELDSIFVKPYFTFSSKNLQEKETNLEDEWELGLAESENRIEFSEIFDSDKNYIVLGDPGSGKSLLIKSILLYISSQSPQFNNKIILSYIPFRIELKSYLSFKKVKGGNILKYLTYILETEFSISGILVENITTVIQREKTILFFDGLDEIFNISDKIEIKNDIENFHNIFPNIRSITTSRFIGYNEARLNEDNFFELYINSFSREQIKEYVTKWYTLEEANQEIRNNEIFDFISKMNNVDNELLSNPLLLSLIVILYRNNLKIPDSKLEIYQSCASTLVDKWDASKNLDIQIDSRVLQKKEPIFSDLAFWQYETLSSSNLEVTYGRAKNIVAQSLVKKNLADEDNCLILAEIFLNYAQNRSIYFDNNFTHKTFLEYYTAFWIYSNIELKHNIVERNNILRKYIANPFWAIVLELLLNLIDKNQPDTEILDEIFIENSKNNDALPFLVYVIPNIKNLSYEVQVSVYTSALIYLTQLPESSIKKTEKCRNIFDGICKNIELPSQYDLLLSAYNRLGEENWNKNLCVLINELTFFPRKKSGLSEINKFLNSDLYERERKKDPYLFQIDTFRTNHSDSNYLEETILYLDLFETSSLFNSHESMYDNYYLGPHFSYVLHNLLKKENIKKINQNIDYLVRGNLRYSDIIKYLINTPFILSIEDESIQCLLNEVEREYFKVDLIVYFLILRLQFSPHKLGHRESTKELSDFQVSKETQSFLSSIIKLDTDVETIIYVFNRYKVDSKELLDSLESE